MVIVQKELEVDKSSKIGWFVQTIFETEQPTESFKTWAIQFLSMLISHSKYRWLIQSIFWMECTGTVSSIIGCFVQYIYWQNQHTNSSSKFGRFVGIFSKITIYCEHGMCYGFEVLQTCESPKHPYQIFKSDSLADFPLIIFVTSMCTLNREPRFFSAHSIYRM